MKTTTILIKSLLASFLLLSCGNMNEKNTNNDNPYYETSKAYEEIDEAVELLLGHKNGSYELLNDYGDVEEIIFLDDELKNFYFVMDF